MKTKLRISALKRIRLASSFGATAAAIVLASLCVLGDGCATDNDLHVIEIRAAQARESSGHPGLSASVATNLFQDVASRLGSLGLANPPHCINPDPAKPAWVQYDVSFTPEGGYTVDISMDMDGKHITFIGTADIDPKTDAALRKAMKLFLESLDARRIKYTVREISTHEILMPS